MLIDDEDDEELEEEEDEEGVSTVDRMVMEPCVSTMGCSPAICVEISSCEIAVTVAVNCLIKVDPSA